MGESLQVDGFFQHVEEKDSGVYNCVRSYLYDNQIYNMTFRVALDIQPKGKKHLTSIFICCLKTLSSTYDCNMFCSTEKSGHSVIISPLENEVFPVDLGELNVIF